MSLPLLSICCSAYNHEKYINQTIEGFLIQKTTFPIEIIIHDDASTDNTAKIIKSFAEKDDRIITILQTENQYSQKNKPWANFVFPKAKGKYIALCEGDDYWTDPLKLQKQVDFLENNLDFELCFHNSTKYFQETGEFEINFASSDIPDVTTVVDLVDYCFIATLTVVMRNNFKVPLWFDDLQVSDWPLFFIQVGAGKIKKLDDNMAVYRIHEKGMWSSKTKMDQMETNFETIKALFENRVLPEQAHKELKRKYNKLKKKIRKHNIKQFLKIKV